MRGKKVRRMQSRGTEYIPMVHRLTEEELEIWYSEPCLAIAD